MSGLAQDIRHAIRQLRKAPVFTIVAVITLALAVGANTAIFSAVHQVLLAPLPYPHVERLVMIWSRNPSRGDQLFSNSAGDFTDWKHKNDVFEDVAASYDNEVTLTGAGEPRLVLGYAFTPNYFRILGVAPKMGRTFTEEEAHSGTKAVVLSDRMWRSTFQADPNILSKSIILDDKPYAIVGVMPPDFDYPPQTELWMPLSLSPAATADYEHRYLRVVGRMRPGISASEAQVRMNALERQIASEHPVTDAGNQTEVEPVRDHLSGDIRTPLYAMLGAVAFVLLIACVNVAGLLLARAASRRADVSIRAAMGASRFRLLQQFLTESLLLSLLGGTLGVLLALWCTRFLVAIFPNKVHNLRIPIVEVIPLNAPVFWFALGVTVLTALLFGAIPAIQSARATGEDALKEFSRSLSPSWRTTRARRTLVTAEVALSFILLTGAGLMIASFRRVYREDLGFRPDHLLALEVFLAGSRYPNNQPQRQWTFADDVCRRLKRLPGVRSVAVTNYLPLTGFGGGTDFAIEGQPLNNRTVKPVADNRLVTPGYFSTMGMALVKGRDFTDFDRSDTEPVAIINSTLAHRYFPGEDSLGRILELGEAGHLQRWRIVGLVSDVRASGAEQVAHAELYRPLAQAPSPLLAFAVSTTDEPARLLNAAKQAIWDVDKDQPVFDAMPMPLLAAQSVTLRRVSTIVLATFATLALVLAAVGLYGMMAYSVVQRNHEIGIRMALGAQHNDVLRLIVRNGIQLVFIGELIGVVAGLVLTHAASGLLYRVSPSDPGILAAALGLLTLVAFVASYVPARRAAQVDPILALRCQ